MYRLITALTVLVYEAQKDAAALIVLQKRKARKREPLSAFLEICEKALEQQMLSIVSKTFDSSSTHGHTNCSIQTLITQCTEQKVNSAILETIDRLIEEYQCIVSKDVRNKRLAHLDYDSLKDGISYYIDFESLLGLIDGLCELLSAVSNEVLKGEVSFPKTNDLVTGLEKGLGLTENANLAEA